MRTVTSSHTHTTITSPAINPNPDIPSIRSIVLSGLVKGESKKTIMAKVTELYPTSAAAAKPDKHYGWYKSRANKVGTPEYKQVQKLIAGEQVTEAEGNPTLASDDEGAE